MKLKSIFLSLSLIVIFSGHIKGQCNPAVILQNVHGWAKTTDGLLTKPSSSNQAKEQQIVKAMAAIVQALYPKPKGGEALWYGYYDGKKIPGQYSEVYSSNVVFRIYQCVNGKEVLSFGNSCSIFININHLGDLDNRIQMNGKTWYTVSALTEQKDGYTYFVFDPEEKNDQSEQWIITYKDKLPYTYVTRKEYLTELRAERQRDYDKMVKEAQETHKQNPETFVNQAKQIYGKVLAIIDDLLANRGEDYLSKPALVLPYGASNFNGFMENPTDKNYVYFIRDNPAYYNKNLPVTTPQYITVVVKHLVKVPASLMFYHSVGTKLLLEKLAAQLGK